MSQEPNWRRAFKKGDYRLGLSPWDLLDTVPGSLPEVKAKGRFTVSHIAPLEG